jgi:hypothetical protein
MSVWFDPLFGLVVELAILAGLAIATLAAASVGRVDRWPQWDENTSKAGSLRAATGRNGSVRVSRPSRRFGRAQPVVVLIDGVEVGRLSNNGHIAVEVAPGPHKFEALTVRFGPDARPIVVNETETTDVVVTAPPYLQAIRTRVTLQSPAPRIARWTIEVVESSATGPTVP